MKVSNSLRSLKKRHKDCQVVRRRGRVYVICKSNPRFKALSTRLEDLKKRFDEGQMHSIAFLKELLDIARDVRSAFRSWPSPSLCNVGLGFRLVRL